MRKQLFNTSLLLFSAVIGVAQNIGINTSPPVHARLETRGTVGAAAAMFGADMYGITIEADNPEIGFNYFYNNGTKTLKPGYAAYFGMSPSDGDIYIGGFNGNQSVADFGDISGARENMRIKQNGNIGIGTTAPGYPLTVHGLASGAGMVQESQNGLVQVGFWTFTNAAYIQTWSNTDLGFSTNNGLPYVVLQTNGNLRTKNIVLSKLLTTPASGPANMLPLAYGKVDYDGTVKNATSNVTITKTGTGTYELSIAGETAMYANSINYIVILSSGGTGPVTYIIKTNNTIEVNTWDTYIDRTNNTCGCSAHSHINNAYAGVKNDGLFNFVVYKYN